MSTTRYLVALAGAGLLLVGCGQPTDGVLIGVRAHSEVASVVASFDPASITAEIDLQLAQLDNLAAIHDSITSGELPLDSTLRPKQRERLATDQQIGFAYIADRLAGLASVRAQAVSYPMQDWQRANLITLTDSTTLALKQIRIKLEQDLLVTQARSDKARVLRLRVDSLLLPEARLLITGYLLQHLAAVYTKQKASLQQSVFTAQANGNDVTVAQAAVDDLGNRIAAMNQRSAAGLAQLQGLTAAGYPGNKRQLLSARSFLTSGKYSSDQAANDIARARTALGL